MSNILGNNLKVTIFGQSHGEAIGCVIDGLCAGIKIDEEFINECLSKRRPNGIGETKRVELDNYKIISGVFNGYTTGSSICILIENNNTKSKDYESIKDLARPSHVDYVANEKYHGFNDYRGGGSFSGRLTAPLVIAGSIALKALEKLGIKIASHIKQIGDVYDASFNNVTKEVEEVNNKEFPTINDVSKDMLNEMEKAAMDNDSIGGVIETAIVNIPVGIGQPMFSSIESELAKAMFSIGGIKGIEFGLGFEFANVKGSFANDEFAIKDGKVITLTNNNGGINGGISNGMPIVFSVVVKPTPSIGKMQNTINMKTLKETTINVTGRHDPCIVRRVNIVVRCMCALVIADLLINKYGQEVFLKEGLK